MATVARVVRRRRSSALIGVLSGAVLLLGYHSSLLRSWFAAGRLCVGASCVTAEAERQLLTLVNQQRTASGCLPVSPDDSLTNAARTYARVLSARGTSELAVREDIAQQTAQIRAEAVGYSGSVAQSVAVGLPSAQSVMALWLRRGVPSVAGTRLTDCRWRHVGIAYRSDRVAPTFGEGIWVLELGDR